MIYFIMLALVFITTIAGFLAYRNPLRALAYLKVVGLWLGFCGEVLMLATQYTFRVIKHFGPFVLKLGLLVLGFCKDVLVLVATYVFRWLLDDIFRKQNITLVIYYGFLGGLVYFWMMVMFSKSITLPFKLVVCLLYLVQILYDAVLLNPPDAGIMLFLGLYVGRCARGGPFLLLFRGLFTKMIIVNTTYREGKFLVENIITPDDKLKGSAEISFKFGPDLENMPDFVRTGLTDGALAAIERASKGAIREWAGNKQKPTKWDELITMGKESSERLIQRVAGNAINIPVEAILNGTAHYRMPGYGIDLCKLEQTKLFPPEKLMTAYEQVLVEEQQLKTRLTTFRAMGQGAAILKKEFPSNTIEDSEYLGHGEFIVGITDEDSNAKGRMYNPGAVRSLKGLIQLGNITIGGDSDGKKK